MKIHNHTIKIYRPNNKKYINYNIKQEYNHIYIDKKKNLKNMRKCDNSEIHVNSNFLLSICLLIILDNLLLVPSLHCNTSLHFTNTSPNYTSLHLSTLHFLTFTLHYPLIWLNSVTFPSVLFHLTSLHTVHFSHLHIQGVPGGMDKTSGECSLC